MLPKPSLVLQVKLTPEDYSEAAAAEIKRSYMYIAQSIVGALPEEERGDGNVMRLSIRLMKPYWDEKDPAAQELWRDSFMPWLANATRNMSTAMHNFNTVLHPLGCGNVTYGWAEYDFAPHGLFSVKMDDENRITAEAPALIDRARTLMNASAFGENVAAIRMPSRASLAAQKEAYEEALRRFRETRAAEGNDEGVAEPLSDEAVEDAEAAASVAEEVEGVEGAEAVEATEAVETVVVENDPMAEDAEEVPTEAADGAAPAAAEPVFAIDYGTWGIEYADGTVVEFDSRTA